MARDNDDPFLASQAASQASNARPTQVLVAQTNDVRPFARLLRGIGLKHNAVMTISDAGFEVTVEEVKSLCAIAFIPVNLFQTFEYHAPIGAAPVFEISLDSLLQCLNIFGNAGGGGGGGAGGGMIGKSKRRWAGEGDDGGDENSGSSGRSGAGGRDRRTGMRMTWAGHGERLSMFLVKNVPQIEQDDGKGPITTCELSTYQPEEIMNQPFDHDNRCLYLIMKSEWLRDALLDLPPSCDRITLTATPARSERPDVLAAATSSSNLRRTHKADVGNFGIRARGDNSETQLDYPNDKEVMDRFEVDTEVSFSYHSSHFAMLSRALAQSIKIALMIEESGFLCVQIMMPVNRDLNVGDHQGILEFKMHALEDDD